MSKLRNTGITDKRGFPHPCYVATATQNLKDFRNSSLWTCSHIKAAPWDDINFRFYSCNEVVYDPDQEFIFFRVFRFLQIFLFNISMKPEGTQTNDLYT